MPGTATLVTCHGLDASGVTPGPWLVISPIGKNKADSFSPRIKPAYIARGENRLSLSLFLYLLFICKLYNLIRCEIVCRNCY